MSRVPVSEPVFEGDDEPSLDDLMDQRVHWLIRYDTEDGEPYGESCACVIGDDHNSLGELSS